MSAYSTKDWWWRLNPSPVIIPSSIRIQAADKVVQKLKDSGKLKDDVDLNEVKLLVLNILEKER